MDNRLVALAISVAMCGSSTPCFAGGDVDPISASQWNGFYAGGHLGGAWGDSSWAYKNPNWFNTLGPEIVISNFAVDAGGFVGGGQTGFTINLALGYSALKAHSPEPQLMVMSKAHFSRKPTAIR
jgi:opacity protein-like surface antigen